MSLIPAMPRHCSEMLGTRSPGVTLIVGVIVYENFDAENCSNKKSVKYVYSGSDEGSLTKTKSPGMTSKRRTNGRRHPMMNGYDCGKR
ncbi:hypothetical protein DPMN_136526 [Dreissena polymorpha]|uniref:Uncharacterized protein n=1 Tax=Dreissena polymorpha TaxID=45954 RepID=A0A9D4JDV4_DREPO|nr:hypothetical protein DPMN_136526 [Dreissena polymorpha]